MPFALQASTALRKLYNLVDNIRTLGPARATSLYRYRLGEKLLDRRLGIRTTGLVGNAALEHSEHCHGYEAMHYGCLRTAMNYFAPDPNRDVMLDYGCGMGRAVVVAATFSFRRVIGVELSESLCDVARNNLRQAVRHLSCRDVRILNADATTYEVPPDVTAVFMFNPFAGPALQAVLERLAESLRRSPRAMRIVYVYPLHKTNEFARCPWLARDVTLPTFDWDDVAMIGYRAVLDALA